MKALVIGFGSIGSRHAAILKRLGCDVAAVTQRDAAGFVTFATLDDALQHHKPEYVVVANATSGHYETLSDLGAAEYAGRVLVEKPIFADHQPIPPNRFESLYVGYNLRFHPLLQRLKEIIASERVWVAGIRVGQHLSSWRNGDYRKCYSSRRSQGGGVLRDLSHEIDYTQWLLGRWERVAAVGGKVSDLEIDSDDAFALLLVTDRCPVISLQLDYLDRRGRRDITIQRTGDTVRADLLNGVLEVGNTTESCAIDRDETYARQHEAVLFGTNQATLCTAEEALEALRLLHAAETAAQQRVWVENPDGKRHSDITS